MQPLFIGPYNLGVQQNLKPFMIPEEAFVDMLNVYVFRGRVEKKAGYQLLGRLRHVFTGIVTAPDITSADSTIDLKTRLGIPVTEVNSSISSGFTVTIGAPTSQVLTDLLAPDPLQPVGDNVNISPYNPVLGITSAVVNYSTGIITLVWTGVFGASSVTITASYFPGLPVMGIRNREIPTAVNTEQTIFFDTVYAYSFAGGSFQKLQSTLPVTWSGTDYQQFWSTNFKEDDVNNPLFWVTNNVPGLHAYEVTAFAGAAAGPPSTVTVTTSTANNYALGDIVSFANLTGAAAANNGLIGTVTVIGNPFTISNPATGVWTNDAATTGIVAGSRLIAQNTAAQDGIRVYNGNTWGNFNPMVNGLTVVTGCLMIVPFKGRLVLLSTWEGNNSTTSINYEQRARWSQNVGQGGNILDQGVGWRDDIAGRGGYTDAATNEQIISCGFVKDELIVYFERSTWKLIYTGNEISPFIWQRINSELGAESTFSATQFDNGLLAFGNVGIHTSNGSAVERIDTPIPDEVFNAHNNTDGPLRTSSIRDFFQEIVYFAYADDEDNTGGAGGKISFPNKMIVYNYRNNTFSFYDDNATCFGPFQRVADVPWSSLTSPFTWAAWNQPWNSGSLKAQFPSVAFGNQQGFVEIIQPFFTSNDSSLWVQNIVGNTVTSPQHNLFEGQYVIFRNADGMTNLNNLTFQIQNVLDENTFTIDGSPTGTYNGNGTMEVLSEIKVLTKQFTPFWTKGNRYELKYIDILFDKTSAGEVAVDVFVDFSNTNSMTDTSTGVVLGAATVSTAPESTNLPYYSFQQQGNQIWKRFYTVAMGETFQVQFSFNDSQMRTTQQVNADMVIHAMIFHFAETGSFY